MTTTTTKANPREELSAKLGQLAGLGVINSYTAVNPTGNKLVWVLDFDEHGEDSLDLGTPEAKAFVAGALRAQAAIGRTGRAPKMTPVREAILAEGRAVVDIKSEDAVRGQRNKLFADGYAVGFKGRFHVSRQGDKLVGETDAYRAVQA